LKKRKKHQVCGGCRASVNDRSHVLEQIKTGHHTKITKKIICFFINTVYFTPPQTFVNHKLTCKRSVAISGLS